MVGRAELEEQRRVARQAAGGEAGAGTGLRTLRGRLAVLGGELDARASRGRFELCARLPWEATA